MGRERVAVLGFSVGGPPALQFATLYPDRTWALILISAVTKALIESKPRPTTFRRTTDQLFRRDFTNWLIAHAVMRFPKQLLLNQDNILLSTKDREILRQNDDKLRFLIDIAANKMGPWSLRHAGNMNGTIQLARINDQKQLPISWRSLKATKKDSKQF